MIPDGQKDRGLAESRDLAPEEVVPGDLEVVGDGERRRTGHSPFGKDVLVEIVDRAEISQVPVERRGVGVGARRHGRHHDVSAVA